MPALGTIYVELSIDDKVFKQKLSDELKSTQATAGGIERVWKQLGTKSDAMFKAEAQAYQNAMTLIRNSTKSTERDVARAQAIVTAKLKELNAEQMNGVAIATKQESSIAGQVRGLLRLYAAYYIVSSAVSAVSRTIMSAMDTIERFNSSVTTMAALITSSMKLKSGETIAQGYQLARAYATSLVQTLEQIDRHSSMSLTELNEMATVMIQNRSILDINNKEAVKGFAEVTNAMSAMIGNVPDRMRQITQETNALLTGQTKVGDKFARLVASMTPDFENQLKIHREARNEWVWLGGLVKGFAEAQGDIDRSWTTMKSTLATIFVQITRVGAGKMFEDVVAQTARLSAWLDEHRTQIERAIKEGWEVFKTTVLGTFETVRAGVKIFWELRDVIMAVAVAYTAHFVVSTIAAWKETTTLITKTKELIKLAKELELLKLFGGKGGLIAIGVGTAAYGAKKTYDQQKEWEKLIKEGSWEDVTAQIAVYTKKVQEGMTQERAYASAMNMGNDAYVKRLDQLKRRRDELMALGDIMPASLLGGEPPELNTINKDNEKHASTLETIQQQTAEWRRKIEEMNPALDKQDSEILKLTNDMDKLIEQIQKSGKAGGVDTAGYIKAIREQAELGKEFIGAKLHQEEFAKWNEARNKELADYEKLLNEETQMGMSENTRRINHELVKEQEKLAWLAEIRDAYGIETADAEIKVKENAKRTIRELETKHAADIASINFELIRGIKGMEDWAHELRMAQIKAEAEALKEKGADPRAIAAMVEEQKRLALLAKNRATGTFGEGMKDGLDEYVRHMRTAFEEGERIINDFADTSKSTLSSVFSDAMRGELKSFREYLLDFVQSLSDAWADMCAQMVVDWAAAQVQMATAQAAASSSSGWLGMALSFVGALFGGSSSLSAPSTSVGAVVAKGGVFSGGNITPFARGGIVDRPTIFPMARGAGLMGEAGPEAVMPLTRTPSGELGVKAQGGSGATYNITIQAVDARSFSELVRRNPRAIVDAVDQNLKDGGSLRHTIARTRVA